jgi:hypothetical protein
MASRGLVVARNLDVELAGLHAAEKSLEVCNEAPEAVGQRRGVAVGVGAARSAHAHFETCS